LVVWDNRAFGTACRWSTRNQYTFNGTCILLARSSPPGEGDFSTRWRLMKSRFAKALPKQQRLSAVRQALGERGILQRRFWEHLIRDEADYASRVEYCYISPLKQRLVARVRDWPHPSFYRDVREELFAED
jgi:putative transposase